MGESKAVTVGKINPFRYRGYYYDEETHLYYLQSRYYDPETGRFINMDNIDYADPTVVNGLNLYAYCNNNPVMYVDPTGHVFVLVLLAIVGVLAGGVINGLIAGANASEGESFGSAFLGGFINGVLSGAGLALGLAIGGVPGALIAVSLGFAGGFLGNATSQEISYHTVDWKVAALAGGISAGTNLMLYIGLYTSGMYSSAGSIFTRLLDNLAIDIIPVVISFYLSTLPIFNPNDLRGKLY